MNKFGYRPARSQQLLIISQIPKKAWNEKIIVHHVLLDTYTNLIVQVERWSNNVVSYERIKL